MQSNLAAVESAAETALRARVAQLESELLTVRAQSSDKNEEMGTRQHFSSSRERVDDAVADCTGAIIVRGPVTNGAIMAGAATTYSNENLAHTLHFLLHSQPQHHCIVYSHFEGTRDGGSTPLLGVLRRFNKTTHPRGRFSYVLSKPACTPGTAHRNSNKLAILAGLSLLRATQPRARWVLHTRADLPPRLPAIVHVFTAMVLAKPISDARGAGPQRYRLLSSSRFSFSQWAGWCHIDDHM